MQYFHAILFGIQHAMACVERTFADFGWCHVLKPLVRCPGPPGGLASWERMTLCQTPNLPQNGKGRGKLWLKGKGNER